MKVGFMILCLTNFKKTYEWPKLSIGYDRSLDNKFLIYWRSVWTGTLDSGWVFIYPLGVTQKGGSLNCILKGWAMGKNEMPQTKIRFK